MRRLTSVAFLLAALLVLAAPLSGCDLFGDGDDVSCFSGAPPAEITHLDEIPGKVVFSADRIDSTGNRIHGKINGARIYVLDAGELTPLTSHDFTINPAWSPDGTQIAFANGHLASTAGPYLYLMNADGSNPHFLKRDLEASLPALVGWRPTWSPGGTQIAFDWCLNCERGGRNYEISVVTNLADSTFDPEDFRTLTNHPGPDLDPVWSPDGEKIAFLSERNSPDDHHDGLYVADPDGSDPQQLTQRSGMRSYTWAPNGECMAVSFDDEVSLLDPEDGDTETLPLDLPEGASSITFAGWPAPDKMLLVAAGSDRYTDPRDILFVANPITGQVLATKGMEGYDVGRADWFLPSTAR